MTWARSSVPHAPKQGAHELTTDNDTFVLFFIFLCVHLCVHLEPKWFLCVHLCAHHPKWLSFTPRELVNPLCRPPCCTMHQPKGNHMAETNRGRALPLLSPYSVHNSHVCLARQWRGIPRGASLIVSKVAEMLRRHHPLEWCRRAA